MAEIKVEKKNNYWFWIIAVVIALGAIIWLFNGDTDEASEISEVEQLSNEPYEAPNAQTNENQRAADLEAAKAAIMANPDEKAMEFVAFIGDESRMGLDHEYTSEAMVKLVNATIERAVVTDVNIDTELQSAIRKAEAITNDPMDTEHADKIKQAYLSITDVIEKVQTEKYPKLSEDVDELRNAALNIDQLVLTLDQKDKINKFFDEAAEVLQKMNKNS